MWFNTDKKTLRILQHTKSFVLVSLSRAAINFLIDKLNLNYFIDLLEQSNYGMDEVFFSTLNSNLFDFPGGFTTECLINKNYSFYNVGRYLFII